MYFKMLQDGKAYFIALVEDDDVIPYDEHICRKIGISVDQYLKILKEFGPIDYNECGDIIIYDKEQCSKTIEFLKIRYGVMLKLIS